MNNTPSLSIYIHIPFCVKKCRYCDFYSIKYNNETVKNFINSLKVEIGLVKEDLDIEDYTINTLYMGGGTPSLLGKSEFEEIAAIVHDNFKLSGNCEWSIECNPSSFTEKKADGWTSCGVNRISIGIQSCVDKELTLLGRPHTSLQGLETIEICKEKGFNSVGADIMTGIPGQRADSVTESLEKVINTGIVDHLSIYELTINSATPFGRHRKLLPFPSEKEMEKIFHAVRELTSDSGFGQYEISNYAKKGMECRHNTAYWKHLSYVGLGPSAHSFYNRRRFANFSNLGRYTEALRRNKRPVSFDEYIDDSKMAEEIIMLGLRTREGIDMERYAEYAGEPLAGGNTRGFIENLVCEGLAVNEASLLRLTPEGMMRADGIARRLISLLSA